MRKVAVFIGLVCFFLLCSDANIAQQIAVGKKSGSLAEVVEKASKNQFKRDSDLFRIPTPGQLKAWNFIVESVFKDRLSDAAQAIKQLSFPYELSQFTDKTSNREYVLLEEKYPLQAGWGLFVFDPKATSPLIIEVPHPVFDSNTEFQGIDAFLQTGARAFLLAGSHRRASKTISPCTQPRSDDADTYPMSDVAHSIATPFHSIHETLVRLRPASVAVQLHGMGDRGTCPNVFISNGTSTVTTNSKKLLACLIKSNVASEIYDGKTTCPLIALTNVQGRFSNGESADPCSKNARTSPEPGSFIHIEQKPIIRRDRASWQGVIDGIKCAFSQETLAPAEPKRKSFNFKSADNPEITVFYSDPPKIDSKTKVLMVMAGRQRNADVYLDSWVEWGAKNNFLVLSPQFDEKNWPEPLGYNYGNIASGRETLNTANPRTKWAFTVLEQLFDYARPKFGIAVKRYDLFGHSAGGQFVHRFMLFMPDNRVRLAIAANPGFFTLPDPTVKFPYGVKDSPIAIDKKALLEWTNADLILMRGTADVERTENLRQTAEADAQGRNRFERGGFMFSRIKALNPKTKWQLIEVPDVAHDQKGMALGAQKLLLVRK